MEREALWAADQQTCQQVFSILVASAVPKIRNGRFILYRAAALAVRDAPPVEEVDPMETQVEVVVRGRSDTAETVREYALRRLSFGLRRFQHRARHITVRLVDLNGPRRGVDSRCSMTADLVNGGSLFVEATAATPFAAITRAAGRLGEVLRRGSGRNGHASQKFA